MNLAISLLGDLIVIAMEYFLSSYVSAMYSEKANGEVKALSIIVAFWG